MIPKEIVEKISSGKFWLTIICGVVFAYVSIKKIIPADAVVPILTMVFMAYFSKAPQSGGQK